MTSWAVELSGANIALASAELAGAARALGGAVAAPPRDLPPTLSVVKLPTAVAPRSLIDRLAMARRMFELWPETEAARIAERLEREAVDGRTAAFRRLSTPRGSLADREILALATAYRHAGGRIDLGSPERRFSLAQRGSGTLWIGEEVGRVDRRAFDARRMPRLPFQRPVSLAPHLARVAANLASVGPGDRVVDPFVGTGALLLEAALLGARVSGVDRDPTMVRGAVRNFSHVGVEAERMVADDAGVAFDPIGAAGWDAIVTDPPYGRASGTGGEPPAALLLRVLPVWAEKVRAGGRVVVIVPGGPDPLPAPWVCETSVPDRVHGSLTREFRVYARAATGS